MFTDYLNHLRIDAAMRLIIDTDDTINVIGKKVGYEDSNYFYKLFKKYVGVYPNSFKQQNRK
jgi:two-component system response regulator YesN